MLTTKFKTDFPKALEDYKKDKEKVQKFIVGYVMKNTGGKASGQIVMKLIEKTF